MSKQYKARVALDEKVEDCRGRGEWATLGDALGKYAKAVPEDQVTPLVVLADQALWTRHYDEARLKLRQALQIDQKCLEARGLQGKLEWSEGNYDAALEVFNRLHHPKEGREDYAFPSNTPRQMFLIVEALLYHAKAFEGAGQIHHAVVLHHQVIRQASRSGLLNNLSGPVQQTVETSMLAIPRHLEVTDVRGAIRSYRETLNSPFPLSTKCRVQVLKQFSTLLLRGCSSVDYPPIPRLADEVQEAALVLLLLGELVSKAEDKESVGLYDNLVIVFVQTCQLTALAKVFESALHRNPHPLLWYRLALTFSAASKHERALLCIKRALTRKDSSGEREGEGVSQQLSSTQERCLLQLGAQTCLYHVDNTADGIDYAKRALSLATTPAAKSALQTILASGLSLEASRLYASGVHGASSTDGSGPVDAVNALAKEALKLAHEAFRTTPNDFEKSYQLARIYALMNEVPRALQFARLALEKHSADPRGWPLLALLLSTKKLHYFAIRTCDAGLRELPADPLLLLIKAHLQFAMPGVKADEIWPTLQLLLAVLRDSWRSRQQIPAASRLKRSSSWVDVKDEDTHRGGDAAGGGADAPTGTNGGGSSHGTDDGGANGNGGGAGNTNRWFVESVDVTSRAPSPFAVYAARLWVYTARLMMDHGVRDRVMSCLVEARRWHPRSHDIHLMLGRFDALNGDAAAALVNYNTALALVPGHPRVLAAIGHQHLQMGNPNVALPALHAAAEGGASDPGVWMQLADALRSRGSLQAAADALIRAHGEAEVVPVLPFDIVPVWCTRPDVLS